jgi:predicted ATPase
MAVLSEALDRVASGRASVVMIEGEAGIGKTRLLDEVLLDAGTSRPGLTGSRHT